MAEYTLHHDRLGDIKGVVRDNASVQFLGLKYASLTDRFAPPRLMEDLGGSVDATKLGPSVLTPPVGCDIEFGLIQQTLPKPAFPGMSDFDGLNLNITIPGSNAHVMAPSSGVPVIVFIHGGGNMLGGNWTPQNDLARFVSLSVDIGKPVIGVAINYRLGIPGFLDSEEMRERGYPPNRGLLDQEVAFRWLARHIEGFGGNPKAITALGQSAGSVSVLHALGSHEELFKRAVCLSGTEHIWKPLSSEAAENAYQLVLAALELSDSSPESRISRLLEVSPDDLLTKIPPAVRLGPTPDPLLTSRSLPQLPPLQPNQAIDKKTSKTPHPWCEALMIGSTDFDGNVFSLLGVFRDGKDIAGSFIDCISKSIPSDRLPVLETLLKKYKITRQTPDVDVQIPILQFGTDVEYYSSALAYARSSLLNKTYLYYFNEPNPWYGPFKGRATHCQDLAYLFQNFTEKMSYNERQVAGAFARDVFAFAYGEDPYPEFGSAGGLRVYGPSGKSDQGYAYVSEDSVGPSEEIRRLWGEVGLEALSGAWDLYFTR